VSVIGHVQESIPTETKLTEFHAMRKFLNQQV
jgi:hypothetical protein